MFKGKWKIYRKIINYRDFSTCVIAIGEAIFYDFGNNNSLLQENVSINWANSSNSNATKSYLFRIENERENPNSLSIYNFNQPVKLLSGRHFTEDFLPERELMHKLDNFTFNSGSKYKSLYICGSDRYALSFTIISDNSFAMDYNIKGPSKNYHIQSIYSKYST